MKTLVFVIMLALCRFSAAEAGLVRVRSFPVCGSCSGFCGQLPDPGSSSRSCSCDAGCIALDDCCPDFPSACPELFNKSRDFYPSTRARCQNVLIKDGSGTNSYEWLSFVGSCPSDDSVCGFSVGSTEAKLASRIPVMDPATNISFTNAACALCNGVKTAVPWSVEFFCNQDKLPKESNSSLVVDGTATVEYFEVLMKTCKLQVWPPQGAVIHQCTFKIDDCPSDNKTLKEQCYSPFQQLTKTEETATELYHNEACAECYNKSGECGRIDVAAVGVNPTRIGSYSLALLVDFTENKGLIVGRKNCAGDQVWSEIHMRCMPLICKPGYEPMEGKCVSYIVNGYMNFTLHLSLVSKDRQYRFNVSERFIWEELTKNASDVLEQTLHEQHRNVNWTVNSKIMDFAGSANSIYSLSVMTLIYTYSMKEFNSSIDESNCHKLAIVTLKHTFDKLLVNQTDNYASLHFGVSLGDLLGSGEFRDFDCQRHLLKKDRFMIKDGVLEVHGLGREYLPFEYDIQQDGNALVCTYSQEFTSLRFSDALGIFTVVCLAISLMCLFIRLVLHLILPIYHTFPMRLQALMCLSMFLAFLAFLLMPSLESYFYPCYVMGVVTHFGFLSFYCWLSAIAAYTWVSFLPSSSFIKTSQRDASLWPRMLFAWGVPVIIVTTSVIVDQLSPNYDYRPGYGLFRCWFNRRMPLLIFFVAPLACIVVVNLFFFVTTVFHLRQGFRDCNTVVKKSNVKQFRLFAKLFVIMGLTEILSFIVPFVDQTWLWYIYIGCNATMGIFILWAFVITKPVLKDMKACWSNNVSKSSSSTTNSSTSHSTKTTQIKSTDSK